MGNFVPGPSTTSVSAHPSITASWWAGITGTCFLLAGIRQLQLILLKVALLLGVKVHVNVEFRRLVEPPEDQHTHCETVCVCVCLPVCVCVTLCLCPDVGWKMEVSPKSHPVSLLEFDVIIGADGRRNTLPGTRDEAECH